MNKKRFCLNLTIAMIGSVSFGFLRAEAVQRRPRFDQQLNICEECVLGTVPGTELTPGELRFFEGTPQERYIVIDDDTRARDLHTIFFTVVGLTDVEIFRMVDWVVDLPFPGSPLRPLSRTTLGLRGFYRNLPQTHGVMRMGEFVDAFQIPELSFGDVSAAYSVGSGGVGGIGSGTLFRINNLIDWTQHLFGDFNHLFGRPLRLSRGLVPWRGPGVAVDGFQWVVTQTFHRVEMVIARSIDRSIRGLEAGVEHLVNLRFTRPYVERTVFVRMPVEIFRDYDRWMEKHFPEIVVGTQDRFLSATYLELTKDCDKEIALPPSLSVLSDTDDVIMMADETVFDKAPKEMRDYVVPAAWVLNP